MLISENVTNTQSSYVQEGNERGNYNHVIITLCLRFLDSVPEPDSCVHSNEEPQSTDEVIVNQCTFSEETSEGRDGEDIMVTWSA